MSLFVEPYRIIPVMGDYAVARARMPPPGHICYGCGNYNPFPAVCWLLLPGNPGQVEGGERRKRFDKKPCKLFLSSCQNTIRFAFYIAA